MRVLKYLYKTKNLKLTYYRDASVETLDCVEDSDYAGDNLDRKSTTVIIRLLGNLIFWKTLNQNTKFSIFAKYIAISESVTGAISIKNLLCESFNMKFD